MNDLRFALRQLLKNPGFTTVAVAVPGMSSFQLPAAGNRQ